VVPGPVDAWLLALGLLGLVVFGPVGESLIRMLTHRPGPTHWLLMNAAALLVAAVLARKAGRRLVIYHVDPAALDAALRASLGPQPFERTLWGYQDPGGTRGVRVEYSPRWRWAIVEATGPDARALIAALSPRLRAQLGATPAPATEVPLVLFGLSALTMLVPLVVHVLAQPNTRAALRVLLQHLHGG
jgi:hypothetical protein